MQTKDQFGGIKERIILHRMLGISVGALAVFLLGFAIVPVLIASASATNQVAGSINWGVVTLTLDPDYGNGSISDEGHGDVLFNDITPSSNNVASGGSNYGTLKILKKTVGITSASGKYYTVFLSTEGENNNLNLQLPGSEVDSQVNIPAISTNSASFANPQTFSGSGWGFAVPGTTISVNNVTPSYVTPAATVLGEQITANTSDTDIAGASTAYAAVWSPVPVASAAQQIWKASTNNQYGFGTWKENEGTPEEVTIPGDTVNNHFDIYYAIAADTNQLAGTYANKVVYTALASASQLDQVSTNMIRDVAFGGEGDVQTLKFDLVESLPFLEESDIKIVVVPHSTIAAADYDVSALSQNNFAECPVVANSLDSTSGAYTSVQCTMPSLANIKAKSGSSSSDVEDGTGIGSFDYWLNVSGYNYNYLSLAKDANSNNVASFVYAGLQSKYYDAYSAADALATNYARNGETVVTKMQEMATSVCNQTNVWNKKWGNMAKLYRYDATDTDFAWEADAFNIDSDSDGTADTWDPTYHTGKSDKLIYDTTDTLTDVKYGIQDGIGSFALKDTRDGKRYVVRRMGDGNCWMAQNLDLDLFNGMTLSAGDTNINEDWILSESSTLGEAKKGSTSSYWQATHGVETVSLYRYTDYDSVNGTWTSTPIESCTGGTQSLPCYAKTTVAMSGNTPLFYTLDDAGVETASDETNYDNNVAYGKWTINVRKITYNSTTGAYGFTNADSDSCTMYVKKDGTLYDQAGYGFCYVETSGLATILQYGDMANPGYQTRSIPVISKLSSDGDVTIAADDVVNANRGGSRTVYGYNTHPTNAGDFRWRQNADDGAHVFDSGPSYFTSQIADTAIINKPKTASIPVSHALCQTKGYTMGTTSGSLELNGATLSFATCLDSNGQPLADTHMVGNHYNWYAATAGRGSHGNTSSPTESICPKGWRLPYGNSSSKSFIDLMNKTYGAISGMGSDSAILAAPLSYVRGGMFDWGGSAAAAGAFRGAAYEAQYWTGTAAPAIAISANDLYFTSGSLNADYRDARGWGGMIRCVAQ